jgi:hypothetical protein
MEYMSKNNGWFDTARGKVGVVSSVILSRKIRLPVLFINSDLK